MRIARFIVALADRGASLSVCDDDLKSRAPYGVITDADREFVRANKRALIAWLQTPLCDLSRDEQELLGVRPHEPEDDVLVPPNQEFPAPKRAFEVTGGA